MLTTQVIKNSSNAVHYFSAEDNYYSAGEFAPSEWAGRGAAKLQLEGAVNLEIFQQLLDGKIPGVEMPLGKMVDGNRMHRPGWDLTFSAPKSVSIMALVFKDERLIQAHQEACRVALSMIEKECAEGRIKLPAGMTFQKTENIVAALFLHDLSRALDPQLHTHAVVMNATERADGIWRSMASQMGRYDSAASGAIHGFIERVRHHRHYYGMIYQAELAYRVRKLGFQITENFKNKSFEIAGISSQVIECFSKRRFDDILPSLEKHGLSGAKSAEFATLATRQEKTTVDRVSILEAWKTQASDLGVDGKVLLQQARARAIEQMKEPAAETSPANELSHPLQPLPGDASLHSAVKELSRFQSTFSAEELLGVAALYAIRENASIADLLNALKRAEKKGTLLHLEDHNHEIFMAKDTLNQEKRLLKTFSELNTVKPLVRKTYVDKFIANHPEINPHVGKALKPIFIGHHPLLCIDGICEKNKRMLVEPLLHLARSAYQEVIVLTPDALSSQKNREMMESRRFQKFNKSDKSHAIQAWIKSIFVDKKIQTLSVYQYTKQQKSHVRTALNLFKKPALLIVDHAERIPTSLMSDLLEIAKNQKCHIAFLRDAYLPGSIGVGEPLKQLLEHGMQHISFNFPKNNDHHEKTITHAMRGEVRQIFAKIHDRIIEKPHADDRMHAMATHYANLPNHERLKSLSVVQNKVSRDSLSKLTHQLLTENGALGKEFIKVPALIPSNIPQERLQLASSYKPGQWVYFNQADKTLGIPANSYWKVISVNIQQTQVRLEHSSRRFLATKSLSWNPGKMRSYPKDTMGRVELFDEKLREIRVGEILVCRKRMPAASLVKGERLQVISIQDSKLMVTSLDLTHKSIEKTVQLDLKNYSARHIDYGYAFLPHEIFHYSAARILAEHKAVAFTTNQRHFYQTLAKAETVWIYTDNQQKLNARLEQMTGERFSAITQLQVSEAQKKSLNTLIDIITARTQAGDRSVLNHNAILAVDYAIKHLAEREVAFEPQAILQVAMQQALGHVTASDLQQALLQAKEAGVIVQGKDRFQSYCTTLETIQTERDIVRLATLNQGQFPQIALSARIQHHIHGTVLSDEQTNSLRMIAQTRDQVVAVQGFAGTGKTSGLPVLLAILSEQNHAVLGLAPTHKAVKELRQRRVTATTIDQFLGETSSENLNALPKENKNATLVLIVDEISMVSNCKLKTLLETVQQMGCRMVTIGDIWQLTSPEAGHPQRLLQAVVDTAMLTKIQRQKTPVLQHAVKATYARDFVTALDALKESTVEGGLETLVAGYIKLSKQERAKTQLITPAHQDRILANQMIRRHLKHEGTLSGQDITVEILTTKNLTAIERQQVKNYNLGDILSFIGPGKPHGFKKNDYATVLEKHTAHNALVLEKTDGTQHIWVLPKQAKNRRCPVEVFHTEVRDIQAGDQIRFRHTAKDRGIFNADMAAVVAIKRDGILIELHASKQQIILNPKQRADQHWDYAYASTTHSIQGGTDEKAFAFIESHRRLLTTQRGFLVALTRAEYAFNLYTDSRADLLESLQNRPGEKHTALEIIGEFPDKKSLSKEHSTHKISNQVFNQKASVKQIADEKEMSI